MQDIYPSQFLFALSRLQSLSTADIESAIGRLSFIYEGRSKEHDTTAIRHSAGADQNVASSLDAVDRSLTARAKQRLSSKAPVDSGYASAEEDEVLEDEVDERKDSEETLELVRNDSVERDFSIRWLTGFIARSCDWTYPVKELISDEETERREALVERAASLLSMSADVCEDVEESFSRKFDFPLRSSSASISVELGDLLAPDDHSSVGLQSWASAIHFARMMAEKPDSFGLHHTKPLRILELGAGTGMLSIAAAKILHDIRDTSMSSPMTEIVATDYHPDVLANLQANVDLNLPPSHSPSMTVLPLDWQYPDYSVPFDRPFELILAADVVYDPRHASWIKDCVSRLLMRPSVDLPGGGVFWMIIALRNIGRHEGLAADVFNVFPRLKEVSASASENLNLLPDPAGVALKSVMVKDLERSGGVGRVDETGYRLFKICWV